jgi:hypothetical protein
MGYDFHITRAPSWLDSPTHPISRSEWEALVASDSELETSANDWIEAIPERSIERTYATVWIAHPDRVPFWYDDGEIKAKNADTPTRRKMVEIALRLDARVFGDDGEEYGVDGAALPRCPVCGITADVHLTEIRHRFLWFFSYKSESHFCSEHTPARVLKHRNGPTGT